jgi:hypothetical protein
MERITLSLVSHTNVGKTTLARTLLRRDVGEVLDQAHTTDVAEIHHLISTEGCELRLADTPGFGDSVRLLTRLRRHDQPLVWLLQQLWDRFADRPLWCSQQAALNVREEADAVLYLVNAAEDPEEAGYVAPELDLLSWIGRPILLLLNQTGEAGTAPERLAGRVEVWRRAVEKWPVVREVMALDAFSRCWVQESFLLERVVALLPEERRGCMEELRREWDRRNLDVFDRSVEAMARHLATAAADREPLPERATGLAQLRVDQRAAEKRRAMEALGERLQTNTEGLMATLLHLHSLEGETLGELERQIDAYLFDEELVDPERGALVGSVVSGALGGLAADVLAGGLTFGGGLVAGAILGALGGAGLARGYQLVRGEKRPAVSWAPAFLDQLAAQLLLRYLAVAHFGRGRGEFREQEASQHWQTAVRSALQRAAGDWAAAWKQAAKSPDPRSLRRRLTPLVGRAARQVLTATYPQARGLLGGKAAPR